jgi:hypothetical protein
LHGFLKNADFKLCGAYLFDLGGFGVRLAFLKETNIEQAEGAHTMQLASENSMPQVSP